MSEEFNRGPELCPEMPPCSTDTPDGLILKGDWHRERQEFAEALTAYSAAIMLDPRCTEAYRRRGAV